MCSSLFQCAYPHGFKTRFQTACDSIASVLGSSNGQPPLCRLFGNTAALSTDAAMATMTWTGGLLGSIIERAGSKRSCTTAWTEVSPSERGLCLSVISHPGVLIALLGARCAVCVLRSPRAPMWGPPFHMNCIRSETGSCLPSILSPRVGIDAVVSP